jgi:hypothetical protein
MRIWSEALTASPVGMSESSPLTASDEPLAPKYSELKRWEIQAIAVSPAWIAFLCA